jgi:hypothetical protein
VSGSGRRQWFFFWVGGIGDGTLEEKDLQVCSVTCHGRDEDDWLR